MSSAAGQVKAAAAAALSPASIDAFLVHLNKCMQTPGGIDAVLAVICYGARLGSAILNTAGGRAVLHEPVRQLAAVLLALPNRASTLILLKTAATSPSATTAAQPVTSAAAAKATAAASALVLAKRLRALGSLLTEARMMLRLWGLLSMYVWARSLLNQLLARRRAATAQRAATAAVESHDATTAGEKQDEADAAEAIAPSSTIETLIGWTQLASCIGYQVTENWAYLSSKGVLGATPAQQGKLYRWSSRSFSVFVAVELSRLVVQAVHQNSDTPVKKAATLEVHRNLVRYASLAPVMAHWGMEKGFLGETTLSVLGFIPAVLQIQKTWQDV